MIEYGNTFADVAELVDALDLGSSVFDVWVRVPPSALRCLRALSGQDEV